MRSTSLTIVGEVSDRSFEIYRDVLDAAGSLSIDVLIVGATARDLIYEAAFGVPVRRATKDVDFAIQVRDWEEFTDLRDALIGRHGFEDKGTDHRLHLPEPGIWIDIIPFGAISDSDGKLRWPKEPDVEMSTLGFQEAIDTAVRCRVSDKPPLTLNVVHPAILIMLKIFSWQDRRHIKQSDAQDAAYAMRYYVELDNNMERIYDDPSLYEGDFDLDTVGARLAGRDLARLAPGKALNTLRDFLKRQVDLADDSEFFADMQLEPTRLFRDASLYARLLPNLLLGIEESSGR